MAEDRAEMETSLGLIPKVLRTSILQVQSLRCLAVNMQMIFVKSRDEFKDLGLL